MPWPGGMATTAAVDVLGGVSSGGGRAEIPDPALLREAEHMEEVV